MQNGAQHPDIGFELRGHIAIVEIRRPPHNYFDAGLLAGLADVYEALDRNEMCRAIVLAAAGDVFCAGAKHPKPVPGDESQMTQPAISAISRAALRLFRTAVPVVAAVHGAATGGGLGLALSADFRVTCSQARFWANFSQLGFHAGFGLTVTLPRLIGHQNAARLLYTGRRVNGEDAVGMGLADILVDQNVVRARAVSVAEEIAQGSPLAVRSMRHSLQRGLAGEIEVAMERELLEQTWQRQTQDFQEGLQAMAERRSPVFIGQ